MTLALGLSCRMRMHALFGLVLLSHGCGGRQAPLFAATVDTGGHHAGAAIGASEQPRAVCTPYVHVEGPIPVVRTVCEVDDALYQALLGPRRQRRRRRRPVGPLMGFPDSRVEPGGVDERARVAAQEVGALLARPDPVAGVGDPRAARAYLEQLPMSVLLATLDLLEQRGQTAVFLPAWDSGQVPYAHHRLGQALYIRGVSRVAGQPPRDALALAARALDSMRPEQRRDALRYLMAGRSLPRDVETLVEGFLAFEDADVEWREPVAVAGTALGSEAPEPIEPGLWNKPPGEPAELYIGKEAHRAIAKHYRDINIADKVRVNHTPLTTILEELASMGHDTRRYALTSTERALRPDIFNLTRLYIYEIKPQAYAEQAAARATMYIGAMGRAGVSVSLGPPGAPGTAGAVPAPAGVFIFSSPSPGVILYEYRKGRMVPVEVPQEQESAEKRPRWAWELEPIPEEQKQRLFVTAVVTLGLIILAIITAPASA